MQIKPAYGLVLACFATLGTSPALAIEECSGGDRAARKLTCVVDGDTLWVDGEKLRMLEIDAPETFGAACGRERRIGEAAKARLIALMDRDTG